MTDLNSKISGWLETQGYPLEMRVSRVFQNFGFRVIQSDYYEDHETGDPRETDVIASLQKEFDGILCRISFIIECKSSREKPWVLFVSDKAGLASPARVAQRAGNYLAQEFLLKISRSKRVQALSLFSLPSRPAYGVTQAFSSGSDICYAATMSVSNAALARTRLCGPSDPILDIVIPVVVTEAPLFSAFLEADSSIKVKEEENGVLLWRKQLVGMPHTIIHLTTAKNLEDFVGSAKSSVISFFKLIENDFREALQAAHKRVSMPFG